MKYEIVRVGVRFPGRCAACGRHTGDREFQKADTLLLRRAGRFYVAHPGCVGVRTKSVIGGGRKIASDAEEVEV